MRIVVALLCALLLSASASAKETPSCAYCDQPWDTKTRVIAVLADSDGAETYHFDSVWHYLEYLWHAEAENEPWRVLLAGAEDFSTTEAEPSAWLPLAPEFAGDQNTYVWTDAAFPGARKAPFVAAFARSGDATAFAAQHNGTVLSGVELYKKMQERWNESHGPGGEEK
jgi:hypothetical protein